MRNVHNIANGVKMCCKCSDHEYLICFLSKFVNVNNRIVQWNTFRSIKYENIFLYIPVCYIINNDFKIYHFRNLFTLVNFLCIGLPKYHISIFSF